MALDFHNGTVELAHGSGGRATQQLIDGLFLPAFNSPHLDSQADFARFNSEKGQIVIATDSHVVTPLFFPGGDIGSLAVHGTVNDVAMSGAKVKYLSAAFIIEAGFPLASLKALVTSMAKAAQAAGVSIVTGDTKVVEQGQADGVFINTTGIGFVDPEKALSPARIAPGDSIIVSGTMGDHGTAILSSREDSPLRSDLVSDTQALNDLVESMQAAAPNLHCLRDPTRGGLAAALNELAKTSGHGMMLNETAIPIKPAVSACTELLGLDPLYMANEGKLVAFCPKSESDALLEAMRTHPKGRDSAVIGEVTESDRALVQITTAMGGKRILDWRYSDPLPRIC